MSLPGRSTPPGEGRALNKNTTSTALVIDDHELVATSLTYALSAQGFDAHQVPVTSLDAVLDAALKHSPGVALLDLELGTTLEGQVLNGVELVAPLRTQGWTVLVVTGTTDLDQVAAAVAAGAANWVVKGAELAELVTAAVELADGRGRLSEPERREMTERHRRAQHTTGRTAEKLARLSAKERKVLAHLMAGESAADIAQHTYTSIRTVRAQIRSILTKLEVNSQGAATALARNHPTPRHSIPARLWRRMRNRTK